MTQKSRRHRRRTAANDSAQAAPPVAQDRYQKFLPEWMRGSGPAPVRPPRPRPPRPAGGYTPGKFATGDR